MSLLEYAVFEVSLQWWWNLCSYRIDLDKPLLIAVLLCLQWSMLLPTGTGALWLFSRARPAAALQTDQTLQQSAGWQWKRCLS
jgi:hypothetical protein